jgi:hypothetical protein
MALGVMECIAGGYMKRIYYLSNNIDYVKAISDELHQGGISDWNFHVVSRDDAGLYTHHLHGSGPLQRCDFIHWALRGTLFGLALSFFAVVGLLWLTNLPLVAMVSTSLMLTMFSTWVGGLIGISHVHYKVARYYDSLQAGEYLMMVDIPREHAAGIEALIEHHHRGEAKKVGESSRFDNPFESGPLLAYP